MSRPWVWPVLVGVTLVGVTVRVLLGSSGWYLPTQWRGDFVFELRSWRAVIGLTVGAALGLSGVSLQALLRNPLAEPYVLGVSSGAAAGVVGQIWLGQVGYASWIQGAGPWLGAVCGAAVTMVIVWVAGGGSLSRRRQTGGIDPMRLLLVGVVLAAVFGALVMAMNVMAGERLRSDLASWMAGYLDEGASRTMVVGVLGLSTVAGGWLWWRGRSLDAATLSESEAVSLGVDIHRLRVGLYVCGGLLAAGAVALSGPIAFVGLVAAHIGRIAVGPGHRALVPAAALCGAALMVWADAAASGVSAISGIGLLPVGVVTALVGGLLFVVIARQ